MHPPYAAHTKAFAQLLMHQFNGHCQPSHQTWASGLSCCGIPADTSAPNEVTLLLSWLSVFTAETDDLSVWDVKSGCWLRSVARLLSTGRVGATGALNHNENEGPEEMGDASSSGKSGI